MPCLKKYEKIKLSSSKKIPYIYKYKAHRYIDIEPPFFLSPFKIINKENNFRLDGELEINTPEKFYNLVYENRFDESTTLDEIKDCYKGLISDLKTYMEIK